MRWLSKTPIILALALACASATEARAIPLTTLVATNGTILQGDKLFSNFSFPSVLVAIGDVTPVSYSGIDVQGVTVDGEHGLRFTGPFTATYEPGGSLAFVDYHITFDVTTTDPDFLIHDVRQIYTVEHSGNGSPFQTRNVRLRTDVQSCAAIFCSDPDFAVIGPNTTISPTPGLPLPSPTMFNANFVLPHDVDFLRVTQNISLIGSATPLEMDHQQVAFDHVDLTFSQTVVPEPTTLLLLGSGLAAIGGRLRRRGLLLP